VERDDLDYEQAAKKFARDKTKLKAQLKKYAAELKKRVSEHRGEMEKTQDYYQDQVDTLTDQVEGLTEEREYLQEQLDESRRAPVPSKGNKAVVKRLENTIVKLQERLTVQSQQFEHGKETAEKHFSETETKLKLELDEIKQQYKHLQTVLQTERETLTRMRATFSTEKNRFQESYEREKQEEINRILAEKHRVVSEMERKCEVAAEKIVEDRHKYKHKVKEVTADFETKLERMKMGEKALKANLTDSLERERQSVENRMVHMRSTHADEIKKIEEKHKTEISNLRSECDKRIFTGNMELQKQSTKLQEDYEKREKQMNESTHGLVEETSRKLGEVTDLYENLKNEVVRHKRAAERIQENHKQVNQQFLTNLNKQNEEHSLVVKEREERIVALENQLETLRAECRSRLTVSERQLKKEQSDKLAYSKEITRYKQELTKSATITRDSEAKFRQIKDDVLKIKQADAVAHAKEIEEYKAELVKEKAKFEAQMHAQAQAHENRIMLIKTDALKLKNSDQSNLNLMEKKCASAKAQLLEKIRECRTLQGQKDEAEAKVAIMREHVTSRVGEQNSAKEELEKLRETNRTIAKQRQVAVQELRASAIRIQNLQQALTSMQKQGVIKNNEELKTLKEQVDTERKARVQETARVEAIRAQFLNKLNMIENKRGDETTELRKELEVKTRELNSLKHNMQKIRSEAQKSVMKIRSDTQAVVDKMKKENKEKITIDSGIVVKLKNEVGRLQHEIVSLKSNFVNTMNAQVAKDKDSEQKLAAQLAAKDELINKSRTEFQMALARMRNSHIADLKKKTDGKEKELTELLKSRDEEIVVLRENLTEVVKEIKVRTKALEELKVETKKKAEEKPPITKIDDTIKRSRDEALLRVRKQKSDISRLQTDNEQLQTNLQQAQQIITVKDQEIAHINGVYESIKKDYIRNLNEQTSIHEDELVKKQRRIEELERLMMDKIRLADSNRE
jgi:chromosome segregation ATPase